MQHVIRKQRIDLQLNKSLNSFRVQQQFSDHFWKYLVPLLHQEFDHMSTEEEVLSLDHLEIDLGVVTEAQISEEVWNPELYELFKTEVKNAIAEEGVLGAQSGTGLKHTVSRSAYEQWIYYMQKGYLPWNLTQLNIHWYERVLEELDSDHYSREMLRKEIIANELFLLRIIRQHPLPYLIKLVEVLTGEGQNQLFKAVNELRDLLSGRSASEQQSGSANGMTAGTRVFQLTYEGLWTEILKDSSQANGAVLIAAFQLRIDEMVRAAQTDHQYFGQELESSVQETKADLADKKLGNMSRDILRAGNGDEGIFAIHAGLVLIHPFLNSLFQLLGLLERKRFINEAAQEKAIYLLHYIATGENQTDECNLLVPKILCAYPPEQPIPGFVICSELEMEEADTMLKAAIDSWDILQHTSPDGLREGFLQRSGKLQIRNGKIDILVEKSAIDVLLDHLPWNLSRVTLPWLGEIIQVDWR